MKLTKENIHRLIKILFSSVLIELLYISLCIGAKYGSLATDIAFVPIYKVPEMLQTAALTAVIILGGRIFS